jgi:hypothetical protein
MENYAKLNYDTSQLVLFYNGLTYTFNLKDGDAEDYWNSFQLKDFTEKDINFSVDEYDKQGVLNGQVCVYDTIDGQLTNDEIIPVIEAIGDINKYMGIEPKVEPNPSEPTLLFTESDIQDMLKSSNQGGGHVFTWSVEVEGKSVDIKILTI